ADFGLALVFMGIGYVLGSMFPTTIKKNTISVTKNGVHTGGYYIKITDVGSFYVGGHLK
ncbi:MAG: hypothetical protein Edafosvirus44_6, partial [Edafosvirus sp.]